MPLKTSDVGKRKNAGRVNRKQRTIAVAAAAGASSLLGAIFADNASAAVYTYTPMSTTADLWSAGNNWSSAPQSASTTELTFGAQNGSTTFGGSFTDINTDDDSGSTNGAVGGVFSLNILDLGGAGSATTGQPESIMIAAGGSNSLSLVSNGSTTPVVNLYANNGTGTSTLSYNVSAPITLGALTTFQGSGTATFNFSGVISDSGTGIIKTGSSTLTLSGTNLYTGPTTINAGVNSGGINAGILDLSTLNGSAAFSAFTVNPQAQLSVDYGTSGTAAASVTRTGSLTLNGGKLSVTGTSNGNTNDIFGALTLGAAPVNAGTGANTISLSGGNNVIEVTSSTKNTLLTFSSLTYTAGGTVTFSGGVPGGGTAVNIGASPLSPAAAGGINIQFTTAPTVANGGLIGVQVNRRYAPHNGRDHSERHCQ